MGKLNKFEAEIDCELPNKNVAEFNGVLSIGERKIPVGKFSVIVK
jgi:hypothetical protein